jgi:putative transcriptional regulator
MPRRAVLHGLPCALGFVCALLLPCVLAQEASRGIFLVARPDMPDPNFRETVVLLTRGDNTEAVGVILNRPLSRSLAQVLPGERFRRFTEPLYFGGPVAAGALFALFLGEKAPGPAVTLIPGVQLALDPDTIDALLRNPPATVRFFSGYSGWASGQLKNEVDRGDWFILDADAETAFRTDSSKLWQELIRRARAVRADSGGRRTTGQGA